MHNTSKKMREGEVSVVSSFAKARKRGRELTDCRSHRLPTGRTQDAGSDTLQAVKDLVHGHRQADLADQLDRVLQFDQKKN
jgi:hypothetical protein